MNIYDYPEYYDIAFSYRNISKEVNFFEDLFRLHSKIKVSKVLEIASGTSPYLEEWNKLGYKYIGLDNNYQMIKFARKRAIKKQIHAVFYKKNMVHFTLNSFKIDAVYLLLGSLYVGSNNELLNHLDSICDTLKCGGLYILDEAIWFNLNNVTTKKWTLSSNNITVSTTYKAEIVDQFTQIHNEYLKLEINHNKSKKIIESRVLAKYFFPQEFLSLIKIHGKFEFVGWYSDFDINKKPRPNSRQIIVLRKI